MNTHASCSRSFDVTRTQRSRLFGHDMRPARRQPHASACFVEDQRRRVRVSTTSQRCVSVYSEDKDAQLPYLLRSGARDTRRALTAFGRRDAMRALCARYAYESGVAKMSPS